MSPHASPVTSTTLALKEWGAVVWGLLDGRQTLLLRKGGIAEKTFSVASGAAPFVIFPTVAHSHRERVRPEHQDLLTPGAGEVDEARGTFWVRVGLSIVEAVAVRRPDGLDEIQDLHIWTPESVREDRLDFRPRHELQALIVRAVRLPVPVEVARTDAYAGCRSWVELPVAWDGNAGQAVHNDDRLAGDVQRVQRAVG